MKICSYCGKEYIGRRTKYCCQRCYERAGANRWYYRHRQTKKFKIMQLKNQRQWINNNREHFNELQRNNYRRRNDVPEERCRV